MGRKRLLLHKNKVHLCTPVQAMHNFFEFNDSSFSEISLQIKFSINSIFGGSLIVSKSFQVFLGKFGDIDGSYLRVRIFTIDEELSNELKVSTT